MKVTKLDLTRLEVREEQIKQKFDLGEESAVLVNILYTIESYNEVLTQFASNSSIQSEIESLVIYATEKNFRIDRSYSRLSVSVTIDGKHYHISSFVDFQALIIKYVMYPHECIETLIEKKIIKSEFSNLYHCVERAIENQIEFINE